MLAADLSLGADLPTADVATSLVTQGTQGASHVFADTGSHRHGIKFDLRLSGVNAAGETLFTTLLDQSGEPVAPGDSLDDPGYGTYRVGTDGVLTYDPIANLYQDRFAEFLNDPNLPGVAYLSRPARTLALVAQSDTGSLDVLERRQATPRLSNTQPVARTDASFASDDALNLSAMVVTAKDLISVEIDEFFADPDGDEILLTAFQTDSTSNDLVLTATDRDRQLLIDVVGDEFDQTMVSLRVGDHPESTTGREVRLPLRSADSDPLAGLQNPGFQPRGITVLPAAHRPNAHRPDSDSAGDRHLRSDDFARRWNDWRVSTNTYAPGHDRQLRFSAGDVSVDLTTGSATAGISLPIGEVFDDLAIPLGGLVYDTQRVMTQSLAKVIVDRPESETRRIASFKIDVTLEDQSPASISTRSHRITVSDADRTADRYELTVPVLDRMSRPTRSGVLNYTVAVTPEFETAEIGQPDNPYVLRTAGRVVVVEQNNSPSIELTPDASQSHVLELGTGWQIAGLPQLMVDPIDTTLGDAVANPASNSASPDSAYVIIQTPGSDRLSVFRGSVGGPLAAADDRGGSFQSVDLDFLVQDIDEFGTLVQTRGNALDYTTGDGTRYRFERFDTTDPNIDDADPLSQFRVTSILSPDGNEVRIGYLDDVGTATPNAGTHVDAGNIPNAGSIRIDTIKHFRGTTRLPGQVTFRYDADQRIVRIDLSDGRRISLDYAEGLLNTVTQTVADQTISQAFSYSAVAAAPDQTSVPMLVQLIHRSDDEIDQQTSWTFDGDGVSVITEGADVAATTTTPAQSATVHELRTAWNHRFTARGISNPPTDQMLPGDAQHLAQAVTQVSTRTSAGDLQQLVADNVATQGLKPQDRFGDHVTAYALDRRGNVVVQDRLFDPAGGGTADQVLVSRTPVNFDALDNPVRMVDTLGRQVTIAYDYTYPVGANIGGLVWNRGPVRQMPFLANSPSGIEITRREGTRLAVAGRITETVDTLGRRSSYTYDDAGRPLLSIDHRTVDGVDADVVTSRTYDDQGRLDLSINPQGATVDVIDYAPNRPRLPRTVRVTEPEIAGGAVLGGSDRRVWETVTTYDHRGYVDTITTIENGTVVTTETQTHDDRGRLIFRQVQNAATGVAQQTMHAYDSLDREIAVIDPHNTLTTTDYDTAGRVIQTMELTGMTMTGPGTASTDALPQTTTTTYYADGTVRQRQRSDGTNTRHYYDPAAVLTADDKAASPSTSVATQRYGVQYWQVTGLSDSISQTHPSNEAGSVNEETPIALNQITESQIIASRVDEFGRKLTQRNLTSGQSTSLAYPYRFNDIPVISQTPPDDAWLASLIDDEAAQTQHALSELPNFVPQNATPVLGPLQPWDAEAIEATDHYFRQEIPSPPLRFAAVEAESDNTAAAEAEELSFNPFTNFFNTFDVNNDGQATALDALQIINWISRNPDNKVPGEDQDTPPFLDVSGDGTITALDALRVINELARTSNGNTFQLTSPGEIFRFTGSEISWEQPYGDDVSYRLRIRSEAGCRGDFVYEAVSNDAANSAPIDSSIGTGSFYACLSLTTPDGIVREPANNGIAFEVSGIHRVFITGTAMTITTGQGQISGSFGNIAGADFNCNDQAFGAGLIPDWDFSSVIYKAVISDSTESAYDRLDIQGGLFNMQDERLAVSKDDFFDGEIETAIVYTADGLEIPLERFWHGSTIDGKAVSENCNDWSPDGGSSIVGATKSVSWFLGSGGGDCNNSGEALVCVSPLMPPLD
ncbi:dockerin type I domain-containing protein [Rubripirellula obstinata]|nr:dockerin type I domain-containing protein [Rubripirellula obstinata]